MFNKCYEAYELNSRIFNKTIICQAQLYTKLSCFTPIPHYYHHHHHTNHYQSSSLLLLSVIIIIIIIIIITMQCLSRIIPCMGHIVTVDLYQMMLYFIMVINNSVISAPLLVKKKWRKLEGLFFGCEKDHDEAYFLVVNLCEKRSQVIRILLHTSWFGKRSGDFCCLIFSLCDHN